MEMTGKTTEKERKEVAEKTESRGTAQPYTSEIEDRAAEHSRNNPDSEQQDAGRGAPREESGREAE